MNVDANRLFQEIGKMHIQILLLQEENAKIKADAAIDQKFAEGFATEGK